MTHPKPKYPAEHQAGMRVPKGGSSCESCEYLKDAANRICGNKYFIAWNNGSNKIPAAVDEYCSDYYEVRNKALISEESLNTPLDKAFSS